MSGQQSESIKTKIQYSHFILHLNKTRRDKKWKNWGDWHRFARSGTKSFIENFVEFCKGNEEKETFLDYKWNNVQKTLFNSHPFCFLILDPFRALVTRDEERSNLDKVSWKSEIFIETPFRETNVVAASCKRQLKNHGYGGWNCCIGIKTEITYFRL